MEQNKDLHVKNYFEVLGKQIELLSLKSNQINDIKVPNNDDIYQKCKKVQLNSEILFESFQSIDEIANQAENFLAKTVIYALLKIKHNKIDELFRDLEVFVKEIKNSEKDKIINICARLQNDFFSDYILKTRRIIDTILVDYLDEQSIKTSNIDLLREQVYNATSFLELYHLIMDSNLRMNNFSAPQYNLLHNPLNWKKMIPQILAISPENVSLTTFANTNINHHDDPFLIAYLQTKLENVCVNKHLKYLALKSNTRFDVLNNDPINWESTSHDISSIKVLKSQTLQAFGFKSDFDMNAIDFWIKTSNLHSAKTILFCDIFMLLHFSNAKDEKNYQLLENNVF